MTRYRRAEILNGGPLHYAPENEQGVVFLFANLAHKLRMRVDQIRQGFPDWIAYKKTLRQHRVRIEFEYRSAMFRTHRHPPDAEEGGVSLGDTASVAPVVTSLGG